MKKPMKDHPRDGNRARPPTIRGLHLHIDPSTGAAGDMAVAALVDAGVPQEVVLDSVCAMQVRGLLARFHRDEAIRGLRFDVFMLERVHGQPHRHGHRPYSEIVRMLRASRISNGCRALAEKMFARLAVVEAAIHGQSLDEATFHEVGAYDSIADIVGVAAAIDWLSPSSISASPPMVGTGTVACAHGVLPVPAPATAALLEGRPVLGGGEGEMTTPTGALVLTTLADVFGQAPPMRIAARGFGIGTKPFRGRPNALGVALGEPTHR